MHPQRNFKYIITYIKVNGLKGLALVDSSSLIDYISPEFVHIVKLKVIPLAKPIGLQLRYVGSQSMINFSIHTSVQLESKGEKVYLDVVNIDYYDLILSVPSLQQFEICLNFKNEIIHLSKEMISSLQVREEVCMVKPVWRAFTGTAAKYA